MTIVRTMSLTITLAIAGALTLGCGVDEPTSPNDFPAPAFGKGGGGKGGGGGGGGGGATIIDLQFALTHAQDNISSPALAGLAGENSDERIATEDRLTLTYTIPASAAGDLCLADPKLDLIQLFNGREVTSANTRLLVDKKPDKKGNWEHVSRAVVTLSRLPNPVDPGDRHTYEIDLLGFKNRDNYDPLTDVQITETLTETTVTVHNQRVQVEKWSRGRLVERDICQGVVFYTLTASKP